MTDRLRRTIGSLLFLKRHLGLVLVLLIFFALTGYNNYIMPLTTGPDEAAHFQFARFLYRERDLPFTADERHEAGYKSDQPPLNSLLVSTAFLWKDLEDRPYVKLTHSVPRRHLVRDGIVDPTGRAFNVVHTEDPMAGEVLFWHFGRLMSTVFSAMTLVVVYLMVLKFFSERQHNNWWALAAVMSVAFIPTFVFISSVFNYESLLGLWLVLYLLVAVEIIRRSGPPPPEPQRNGWLFFIAGLLIGLAIVTKLSALPAPLSLAVVTVAAGCRASWPIGKVLVRLVLGWIGILIGAGWWFALVVAKLNRIDELGWVAGVLHPIIIGDGSDAASGRVSRLLSTGSFGNGAYLSPAKVSEWAEYTFDTFWSFRERDHGLTLLTVTITLLVLLGLIRIWRQHKAARLWIALSAFHISLFLILPFVRLATTGAASVAGQGHHVLFPTAGAVAILAAWGLSVWVPGRLNKPWLAGIVLGLGLLSWTITHDVFAYQPPTPVPVRTASPVLPAGAAEFTVEFETMTLNGYDLVGLNDDGQCCRPSQAALGVHLYWLAEQTALEDYITTLNLINSRDEVQTAWVGYAADGRYPHRAWEPGDIVRDEIFLPLVGVEPGTYKIALQLSGKQGPLPAESGQTSFILADVEVITTPSLPEAITIWQAGQPAAGLPTFEPRSTIQVTAGLPVDLNLVGPGQTAYSPEGIFGKTQVFVVDPLWPQGEYYLSTSGSPPEADEKAVLTVKGFSRQIDIPPHQVSVGANFANQLQLLGYSLPERHVAAGAVLPVTLHWQALQTMPTDFIMFTRLRDEQGQAWGGYDRWPREYYSPLMWVKNEVVEDSFTVEIDPKAPPGLYYLDVGWYLPVGDAPVSLPLVQDGEMSQITSVSIGPVYVGGPPPAVRQDSPAPQVTLNESFGFGPHLTLLGYDLTHDPESLKLTIYWRSEAPLFVDYSTFVHVRNAAGEMIAQKDRPPLEGKYPTSVWQLGEIVVDQIEIPLPPDGIDDAFQVFVGMYDVNTGERLPVPGRSSQEVGLKSVEAP